MTDVIFNDDSIMGGWSKVTRATGGANVMVMEFKSDNVNCFLSHCSNGGFDALEGCIEQDKIAYCVLRVQCVDIIQSRDRFVFLVWNAPGAPMMNRGKIVFQQQQIMDHLPDVNLFVVEIDGPEKLNQIEVAKVLNENLGSDRPDYYQFSPEDIVEIFEDQLNHITGEMANVFSQKREASHSTVRLTETDMSLSDEIGAAWEDLKKANSNFMVFGLSEDENFELIDTGDGGFEDMIISFEADKILFCVLRVPLIDVVRHQNKFVFITYMGDEVPMVKKARVVFQQQKAKDMLAGARMLNFEISDNASFSQKDLAQYLLTNAGGDYPEKMKFGPNDYIRVVEDQLIHEQTDDDNAPPEEKKQQTDSILGGGAMGSAESIDDAWNKVLNETEGFNFLVVGMTEASKKRRMSAMLESSLDSLELVGTGAGGFQAMRSCFDPKRVMFSILRIPAIDVVGHRNRIVFLIYIGDSTSPKEKSRVVFQSNATKQLFGGATLKEYQIPDNDSLSQVEIAREVDKSSGGGDRPDRYQFGPNDFVLVHSDQFVHSTDAQGVKLKEKKAAPAKPAAESGGTKTYQVKAWKEERLRLKGEKSNLARKLKNVTKRIEELDELIEAA